MSDNKENRILTEADLESLFKQHFKFLCNFANQYVEDLDIAQDICQRVFINLWEKRQDIDPNKSVKSYLFTSVKNKCLNYIRDNKKFRSKVLDLDCGDFDLTVEQDSLSGDDLTDRINSALAELPPKCRLVFEMSRIQGMKYREIAEELELSQKTVEAHMSKAIKTMRERLKDYFVWLLILISYFLTH